MTATVSISDFRENMSEYLSRVRKGNEIILEDKKKGEIIAKIVLKKQFDLVSFKQTLRKVAGTFTIKNHPEWRTKEDVIKSVQKERMDADRTF